MRSVKEKKINNVLSKLDNIVNESIWEAEDLFDHNYSKSSVKDCVCYYINGYVSKQITKYTCQM